MDEDMDQKLFEAVEAGDITELQRLIDAGADVNAMDYYGDTVLRLASKNGNVDCVKALIAAGANLNMQDMSGKTILMIAAENQDFALMSLIIDAGADLYLSGNVPDLPYHNKSVLTYAARESDVNVIRCLLEAGMEIEARDAEGETALMSAYSSLSGNRDEVLCYLIDAGADVNARDSVGWSCYNWSASSANDKKMKQLKEYGAVEDDLSRVLDAAAKLDIDGLRSILSAKLDASCNKQALGKKLGHLVYSSFWRDSDKDEFASRVSMVQLLLDAGADPNFSEGAALYAAEEKIRGGREGGAPEYSQFKELLLAAGAREDLLIDFKLEDAVREGDVTLVRACLEKGADFNKEVWQKGMKCTGPILALAAELGRTEEAVLLIEAGSDGNDAYNGSIFPLISASRNGNVELVNKLIAAGADIDVEQRDIGTALTTAARYGKADVIRALLAAGADVDYREDRQLWSALHFACRFGNTSAAEALLQGGANENIPDCDGKIPRDVAGERFGKDAEAKDKNGYTALQRAVVLGEYDAIKPLVDAGADIEAKDMDGFTPLHRAAALGQYDAIKPLVDAGADIEAKDMDGFTPLHRAAALGQYDAIKPLVDAGADIEAKNKDGWTVLQQAAIHGKYDAIKPLVDAGADVEARDKRGWTALHYSAFQGHTECVKALLDAGADIKAKGEKGWTALTCAEKMDQDEVVELLRAEEVPNSI